jgi:RimJ/RimL family protein N-acetyltransferase
MLTSERLIYKPIDANDIEWLRETRNKYRDNFFDNGEISSEQQRAWYARYREDGRDKMFIVKLKSGEPIGTIAIYNIDAQNRTATLGRVLLLDEFRHHGYAEEMVQRILQLAFESMRLYKVKVEVHYDNIDAIAIYARAGFKPATKPIVFLECKNTKFNPKQPVQLLSQDEDDDAGYESQCKNVI